jgi:uncharacterized protein (TIGR02300 family)
MPKEEWGTKRLCPTTGKRFYDLNRTPIVSPYTGETITVDNARTRTMVADAEDAQTKKLKVADEKLKVGDGLTDGVTLGPLIEPAAVDKVREHLADALSKGGKVLTGGHEHKPRLCLDSGA